MSRLSLRLQPSESLSPSPELCLHHHNTSVPAPGSSCAHDIPALCSGRPNRLFDSTSQHVTAPCHPGAGTEQPTAAWGNAEGGAWAPLLSSATPSPDGLLQALFRQCRATRLQRGGQQAPWVMAAAASGSPQGYRSDPLELDKNAVFSSQLQT